MSTNTVTDSKVGYLGIDESNHGRYPEIFVAVYSTVLEDIFKCGDLGKTRRKEESVYGILENREFIYYSLSEQEADKENKELMKAVIFSKLINAFSGIDTVIIDGEVRSPTIENITSRLYKKKLHILAEPKADKNYPLVNIADRIAYRLFLCYSRNIGVEHRTDYEHHLLKDTIRKAA